MKKFTSTNDGTKTSSVTLDHNGNKTNVVDNGQIINYTYNSMNLVDSMIYSNNVVCYTYDDWGRKITQRDPSFYNNNPFRYEYNAWGDLVREYNPNNDVTSIVYDSRGKIISKTSVGVGTNISINYTYNNNLFITNESGSSNGQNYTKSYTYDSYFRLSSTTETTPYLVTTNNLTYDGFGRVYSKNTASYLVENNTMNNGNPTVKYLYNSWNGVLDRIIKNSGVRNYPGDDPTQYVDNLNNLNNYLYWLKQANERLQAQQIWFGNALTNYTDYNNIGNPTQIRYLNAAGNITMNLNYTYNTARQLILTRNYNITNLFYNDNFTYDNEERLLTWNGGSLNYYADGRINTNSDLGQHLYENNISRYLNTGLIPNSNGITYYNYHQTLSATYNMFRDPISITENTTVNFDYNYNNQRSRVTYANSAKTKYYSEGMQVEVIKNNNDYKFITYIDGDPYSANIIYVKTQSSSGYYYLHRDNQGTILWISDSSGIMIEQRIFDPWGNLKQGSISFIERGYTGHEHFLEISLIHMNARFYDPVKKIFLTPDNVLQDPYNPQNYNKFGYCLNNPLKYTDPSGNEPITITVGAYFIAAGISALISSIFYVAQNAYNQQGFDWGGLGLSILQGAVSGAAAYGIGSAFTTASVVAALGKTGTIFAQAAAHGLSQATISGIFRGDFSNFGSGFAAGAVSSLVGSGISKLQIDNPALRKLSMYLGGAISGGLAASVTGGDFLDGAATGLIVTALNHGLHEAFDPLTSEQQEQKNEKKVNDCLKDKNVDYDPDKAVEYVEEHRFPESNKQCATNVREAIDAGGIDTKIRGNMHLGNPDYTYAKNYDLNLEKWGFTDMKISSLDGYTPKNGDIAVIQNHKGGNIAGHIQMYSAKLKAWILDFKQNKPFYLGNGYQTNKPSFKIYRYFKN